MTNCKYITKNGRCGLKGSYAYRHGCFGEDMCRCREPMANADRIRAMSDEELNELFHEIYNAGAEDAVAYEWGQRTNSFEWTTEWLQQPAGEEDHD